MRLDPDAPLLQVALVLPTGAPPGSGNRVSVDRWSSMLRAAGHRVRVLEAPGLPNQHLDLDVWIGLHAERSAASLDLALAASPKVRAITVLTGTDLHREGGLSPLARHQLERSDRLVVLSPGGLGLLPGELRARTRTIPQVPGDLEPTPLPGGTPTLAMLGHLRPVKDPLVVLDALGHLSESAPLRIVHAGEPLDPALASRCEQASAEDPRYSYLGRIPRSQALATLESSHGLLLPSRSEGGASVLSEALLLGRAVIASDAPGITAFLPKYYGGIFPVGSANNLAALLERFAAQSSWRQELTEQCVAMGAQLRSVEEAKAWQDLVTDRA